MKIIKKTLGNKGVEILRLEGINYLEVPSYSEDTVDEIEARFLKLFESYLKHSIYLQLFEEGDK